MRMLTNGESAVCVLGLTGITFLGFLISLHVKESHHYVLGLFVGLAIGAWLIFWRMQVGG